VDSREKITSKFVGFVVGKAVQSRITSSSEVILVAAWEIPDASRERVALILKFSRRMKATISFEAMRNTYPQKQRHFQGARNRK